MTMTPSILALLALITTVALTQAAEDHRLTLPEEPPCRHLPGILIEPGLEDLHKKASSTWCTSNQTGLGPETPLTETQSQLQAANLQFNNRQIEALVKVHNDYRASVTPLAADMNFIEWDYQLAKAAQEWANLCHFDHGFPTWVKSDLGQNLYWGSDSTGLMAVRMWFNERVDYNIQQNECTPNRVCGHYTQVVWAQSRYLGCGIQKCGGQRYYVVCNYNPPGNYEGQSPYLIGQSCSLCSEPINGGLCFNKTCVSHKQCVQHRLSCECHLQCQNCGSLTPNKCSCRCKAGWEGLDCSVPCMDASESYCTTQIAGYEEIICRSAQVRNMLCRKTCKQCRSAEGASPTDQCCSGKACDSGFVLNARCSCVPKCPGPVCNKSSSMKFNDLAILFMAAISVLHWQHSSD